MAKRLARQEGMLVSPSAAANLVGCLQVAEYARKRGARRDRDHLPRRGRKISGRAFLGRRIEYGVTSRDHACT